MASLVSLMDIIAGLILLTGVMPLIPVIGTDIQKVTKVMAAYQVPLGVIAVIVGILGLLDVISGGDIASVFAILAGIVMATSIFGALPKIGGELKKVAMAIGSVQVIFGIITLIVGVFTIL
jgi:hypothetical protein